MRGEEREVFIYRHSLSVPTGVIAYVDVRSGTNRSINTSQAISESLLGLGATVSTDINTSSRIYMCINCICIIQGII